jgi:hypothetical protein
MEIIYVKIIESSLPLRALRTLRFYFYEIKKTASLFSFVPFVSLVVIPDLKSK